MNSTAIEPENVCASEVHDRVPEQLAHLEDALRLDEIGGAASLVVARGEALRGTERETA